VPAKTGLWHGKAYKKADGTNNYFSTLPLPIESNMPPSSAAMN